MDKIRVYCNLKKEWLDYNYCLALCDAYDKHNQECNHFGGYKVNKIN